MQSYAAGQSSWYCIVYTLQSRQGVDWKYCLTEILEEKIYIKKTFPSRTWYRKICGSHDTPPPSFLFFCCPYAKRFHYITHMSVKGVGEGGAPWNLIRVSIQKLCSISYGKTYMSFVHLTRSVYCLATGLKGAYYKRKNLKSNKFHHFIFNPSYVFTLIE